jgi:hypothetical protein
VLFGLPPALDVSQQELSFQGGLRVEFAEAESLPQEGGRFFGGVVVRYGATELRGEEFIILAEPRTGRASGAVELTHPVGRAKAEAIEFAWSGGELEGGLPGLQARAVNAEVRADRLTARAERLLVFEDHVVLEQAWFSPSSEDAPKAGFTARRLTLYPGQQAVAEGLGIQAAGKSIIVAPRYVFSLNEDAKGLEPPAPSFDSRRGLGVGWQGQFGEPGRWAISANALASARAVPALGLSAGWSLTPGAASRLFPRSDLDGFESGGSFNSVGDRFDPAPHRPAPAASVFASTLWGATPLGRSDFLDRVSKQAEVGAALWGPLASGQYEASLRWQSMRDGPQNPWISRSYGALSWRADPLALGSQLWLTGRMDSAIANAPNDGFLRFQSQAGLVKQLGQDQFGAAVVLGSHSGSGGFAWERSATTAAVHFRADFVRGPYALRLLNKHEADGLRVIERQWEASLAADAFEPFIRFNSNGQGALIGVRLRLGDIGRLLQGSTWAGPGQ